VVDTRTPRRPWRGGRARGRRSYEDAHRSFV